MSYLLQPTPLLGAPAGARVLFRGEALLPEAVPGRLLALRVPAGELEHAPGAVRAAVARELVRGPWTRGGYAQSLGWFVLDADPDRVRRDPAALRWAQRVAWSVGAGPDARGPDQAAQHLRDRDLARAQAPDDPWWREVGRQVFVFAGPERGRRGALAAAPRRAEDGWVVDVALGARTTARCYCADVEPTPALYCTVPAPP